MKEQIEEICNKLNREQLSVYGATNELLNLYNVSLSLLGVSKCPNSNCDNNGTIATQEYPSGEWIPEPCEWCHRKNELLNNEG